MTTLRIRRAAVFVAVAVTAALLSPLGVPPAHATTMSITDLTDAGLSANDLAQDLAGAGVTVSTVTFTGNELAGGRFSAASTVVGLDSGVVLGSGQVIDAIGPNTADNTTTAHGEPGDTDLDLLVGGGTQDAAVLEFDFEPDASEVFLSYVFTSEEYNEFVNSQFDDVFAFFVNGTNCATVGGDRVSINTINNGDPFGSLPSSHPELYINNDLDDGGGAIDTEMDGLTKVLVCQATVTPNATNHMKLAVADRGDALFDTNVFIEAGSLTTTPPEICDNGVDDDGDGLVDGDDPDCQVQPPTEICDNGVDDDGDGLVDGDDPDCQQPAEESVSGLKYYDANANGQYDVGEPGIEGWPIDSSQGSVLTDASGAFSIPVAPGDIEVAERQADAPWAQSGNVVDQSSGTAEVTLNPDKSYTVEVEDGESGADLNFGNLCLGDGGAHTRGFWQNKNGQTLFNTDAPDALAYLQALNLVNEDGSAFDPASYAQFRTWLRSARSVNQAYMLSAQLATMALNVHFGLVDMFDMIEAEGALTANAAGFAPVWLVIFEAHIALGVDPLTPAGDPNRASQATLSGILDAANNNRSFAQADPADCPTPVFHFEFSDTFDAENGGLAALNYAGFANWTVTDGTVDLIGNGVFDFYPGNGLYVDLDGSTSDAGVISSPFALPAGNYTLSFELGGSQLGDTNMVTVTLGSVYTETFTLASTDPLTVVSRNITVASGELAVLSVTNGGGDNIGAILDDVSLTS